MKESAREDARPFRAAGYLACAAGFLLCVVAYYPGYTSPDAVRQLAEARAWSFTDWHPPLMARVWGVPDRVVPGPFGMLVLHNVLFWGALAVFWRVHTGSRYGSAYVSSAWASCPRRWRT